MDSYDFYGFAAVFQWVAASTLCIWNSSRHRNQDDTRRLRTWVGKTLNTMILFRCTSPHSIAFVASSVLKSRVIEVFDRSLPWALFVEEFRAAGMTTRKSYTSPRDDLLNRFMQRVG